MVSRLAMGIIGVNIWFLRSINIRIPHDLPSNVCCSGSKVFRVQHFCPYMGSVSGPPGNGAPRFC